ncbi:NAD(P)-binding protein [Patellaria atrata CBS 101060]|uniref:NAD(P)-binding protein n=1 Tax=Patellaria atrata CBS 101060 TaxID=1346257 RepID=A0A9P4S6C8_9PEZI|nr:NAD(P)-binding protein [Patellaria atrata CBS 101060]
METTLTSFFKTPVFAVAGASSDPTKFGHKVLLWYLQHSLPVHALNPNAPRISFAPSTTLAPVPTLPGPAALPSPAETALSVITPPAVTMRVLREAKRAGVRAVWLQPGSFDAEVEEFARGAFEIVLAGLEGSEGHEGWCVLVDGERGVRGAGREGEGQGGKL